MYTSEGDWLPSRLVKAKPLMMAAVGAYGFLAAFVFSWVPRYWTDEAATVTAAMRSWPDFFGNLSVIDAVHGAYYLSVKIWAGAFGYSEASLRSVSALAVGFTCVMLIRIGPYVGSTKSGLLTALVYPMLPTTLWMGAEARSYALSACLASAVLLAAFHAGAAPRLTRRGAGMCAVIWVVSVYVFLFTVFLLVPIAVIWRRHLKVLGYRTLIVILGGACLAILPVLLAAITQRSQVRWIGSVTSDGLAQAVLFEQYFRGETWVALICGLAAVAGTWIGLRNVATRSATSAVLAWLVIPIVVLGLSGLLLPEGLYLPRYLSFTTPAVALLVGGLASVKVPRFAGVVVWVIPVMLAALALEPLLSRDDPMQRSSWDHALQVIESRAQAGDGWVAYSPFTHPVAYAYPSTFQSMPMLNATEPKTRITRALPTVGFALPEANVPAGVTRVWVLVDSSSREQGAIDMLALERQGFRVVWEDPAPIGPDGLVIHLLERGDSSLS